MCTRDGTKLMYEGFSTHLRCWREVPGARRWLCTCFVFVTQDEVTTSNGITTTLCSSVEVVEGAISSVDLTAAEPMIQEISGEDEQMAEGCWVARMLEEEAERNAELVEAKRRILYAGGVE